MKWKKKGLIFTVNNNYNWMKSHASLPIADKISQNIFRVYFSTRNSQNFSHVCYFDWNIEQPEKVISISKKPILTPGSLGTFDDSGAMASSIVSHKGKKFMYYIGWNQSKSIPFRWSIGLAISESKGKNFKKFSDGPIFERNFLDPYFVSSPTVIKENNIWKMWYISGTKWELFNGELRNPYNIRYAESKDGISWKPTGKVCVDFKNKKETRIGRASILKEKNLYKMWYSHAGEKYRIGYAESTNGITWQRKDSKVGITISNSGWDSEMIEYSYIFRHKNNLYMLYNGNNYGQTGIGYAILEK